MTHSEDSLNWFAFYRKKQYTDRAMGEGMRCGWWWEYRPSKTQGRSIAIKREKRMIL